VCTALVTLYRAYLGGLGQWAGIGAIVTAGLLGAVFWHCRSYFRSLDPTISLILLGACLAAQAIMWTFTLPWTLAISMMEKFIVPIPLAYIVGTVLFGHLFMFESNRQKSKWALKEAMLKAEEANRLKGLFLANMSHEIRTPLTSIVGAINVLSHTELSDEQRKFMHILKRGSSTLLDIVSNLLDLSKIEAGAVELNLGPVSLSELASSVLDLFSLLAQQKGLALRVEISPQLPAVLTADEWKLRQTLTNLVGNAIKFTETGCVTLQVMERKVSDTCASIEFSVRDTGTGIKAEHHQNVFHAFHQGDSAPNMKQQGTGLGLTIAKQFVQAMGGTLRLESQQGRGTCFSFVLELQRSP